MNRKIPQKHINYLWHPFIRKAKRTNGGNGYVEHIMRKGRLSLGVFLEELWSSFGPTNCEDFDEALSKIEQKGSLRDYQKEFERLGNKVSRLTQKALVGTFMGGLEPEIAEGIRMFKPKTLKEAISLARMKGDHLIQQKKSVPMSSTTSSIIKSSPIMKRLSWEEM